MTRYIVRMLPASLALAHGAAMLAEGVSILPDPASIRDAGTIVRECIGKAGAMQDVTNKNGVTTKKLVGKVDADSEAWTYVRSLLADAGSGGILALFAAAAAKDDDVLEDGDDLPGCRRYARAVISRVRLQSRAALRAGHALVYSLADGTQVVVHAADSKVTPKAIGERIGAASVTRARVNRAMNAYAVPAVGKAHAAPLALPAGD